jgi:hypothetical protein
MLIIKGSVQDSRLVVWAVVFLAGLTASSPCAQGVSRLVTLQILGKPYAAVAGKRLRNIYTERCNRPVREDILDAHLLNSLQKVGVFAERCIEGFNVICPHESLGGTAWYQFNLSQS